jgi:hypothetical protein
VRHCVYDEIDAELERFGGRFDLVLRTIDKFPVVSDILLVPSPVVSDMI